LVGRAVARCGPRARELRRVHRTLLALARVLEPDDAARAGLGLPPRSGATVRAQVALILGHLRIRCLAGAIPAWLRPGVEHLVAVLRRLGPGLYHCYDVPGLPRTDNTMEQFYRRVKREQRRITGRRRADAFVARIGGFAVYAAAASAIPEAALLRRLAAVPAADWQQERITLRANQDRQAKLRRFRLDPTAYLADLEARWAALAHPP
jgi:hypothetical protein